ncbi:MAG: hypothetical protein HC880_00005 [Bacteroidia bacterium]|nr:hypothetical protein [Bacteroidia bacterium]
MASECNNGSLAPCSEEITNIPFQAISSSNALTCSLQNINEDELIVNLVINSQTDFEKYVKCSDENLPSINFSENTLLAGRVISPNCGIIKNQAINKHCQDYIFTVKLEPGVCGAVTQVSYFAITSKIPNSSNIEFNIQQ